MFCYEATTETSGVGVVVTPLSGLDREPSRTCRLLFILEILRCSTWMVHSSARRVSLEGKVIRLRQFVSSSLAKYCDSPGSAEATTRSSCPLDTNRNAADVAS
jgi:hypothetical protein